MMSETGGTFPDPNGAVEYIRPIPERSYAPVFPYRGVQQHGVPIENDPWIPATADEQSWQGEENFDPAVVPIAPIPVEIVNSSGDEIRSWRSVHFFIGKTSPVLVVGQNKRMNRILLRHAGPANDDGVIWIGHESSIMPDLSGYPLFARETVELYGGEEIYAMMGAGTGTTVPLAIIIEHTVGG
jgi:hypothetical protein